MQSVLESDQEFTDRQDPEEPMRKQTNMPKSETEVKRAKFWQKTWVPTISYITENVFDTSSRNTSVSVYQHKYSQHFLPISRQPYMTSDYKRA